MAASTARYEYYLSHGTLKAVQNRRQTVRSRWRLAGQLDQLVLTIEDRGKTRKIILGPMGDDPLLVAQALLHYKRLSAKPDTTDIGEEVPQELVRQVAGIAAKEVKALEDYYNNLAEEVDRTGALTLNLTRAGRFEFGGWQATIVVQAFSPKTKEPRTGADMGITVDVRLGETQVSKALWVQAKDVDMFPEDPWTIPEFEDQIDKMLRRTRDAYGLFYSPNGMQVFQGKDHKHRFSF
jgi:hypothetical protein